MRLDSEVIPFKERSSMLFLRYGRLDVEDGAFVLIDEKKPESVRTLLSRLAPQLRSIFLNAFGWDRSFFQLDKASLVRFLGRFGVLMTKIVSR